MSRYNSNSEKIVLFWEKTVAVGPPPAPRYGHEMIVLPVLTHNNDNRTSQLLSQLLTKDIKIAIMGGCTVSPESEITGGLDPGYSTLTDNGAQNLTDAYIEEGKYTKNSITHLLSKISQFNTSENNDNTNNDIYGGSGNNDDNDDTKNNNDDNNNNHDNNNSNNHDNNKNNDNNNNDNNNHNNNPVELNDDGNINRSMALKELYRLGAKIPER
jgi:hypothetical protein